MQKPFPSVLSIASIFLLSALPVAYAQQGQSEKKETSTKLEAFLGKKGLLAVRDIQSCGSIDGPKDDFSHIYISAMAAYQPGQENAKVKGLRCDIFRARSRGVSDSGSSFVDLEEAESLSKALQYLIDLEQKWSGQAMAEGSERQISFATKDDLDIGFSQSGEAGKITRSVSVGSIGRAGIIIDSPDKLVAMKAAVDKGVEWLKKQ